MSLRTFFSKQLIDVIQWTEEPDGVVAQRYPMMDMEIQNGAQLTVRESQMAIFVNEGRIADVFGPGLHTLNTQNLPLLTDLLNWDKGFESPFKSDVYFFSTRLQTAQKWGTATPLTLRDKEFGPVRMRGYGIYAWRIKDPRRFHTALSGTVEQYKVGDIEAQLRETIVSHITDGFAGSEIAFVDMAANQAELARKFSEGLKPSFAELGLELESFVVENVSLPEELQKSLDARAGMNMVGDMNRFTQFQAGSSLPIAAANEGGGGAASGLNMGAGLAMGQQMLKIMNRVEGHGEGVSTLGDAPASAAKFCVNCGKTIMRSAKFCPECGQAQG